MTWQYLTSSPLALLKAHITPIIHTTHLCESTESHLQSERSWICICYIVQHTFSTATRLLLMSGLWGCRSLSPTHWETNVHFTLTPTHNLESPIRRLMVFGLWEEPPCRVSALRLGHWEVFISLYPMMTLPVKSLSQIKHLQFSSLYSSYRVLSNCQVNQSLSHTPLKHIPTHTLGA